MTVFEDEIAAIRLRTAAYASDPEFHAEWFGLTRRSVNLRAQQMRAFGTLVGSVTQTLAGWRILDVGCGSGFWLRTFLEFDALPKDLVGIDVSDARIGIARAKNPLITLLHTNGITIPFKDASFNLVTQFVAFATMRSHALRSHVVSEIIRVLKPGGFVFWWDHYAIAPTDVDTALRPADFFDWPIREIGVGELPRPSECLRSSGGLGSFLVGLDRLGHPVTHTAALIGPKP
jgi:SAM-dependent methyltransferase